MAQLYDSNSGVFEFTVGGFSTPLRGAHATQRRCETTARYWVAGGGFISLLQEGQNPQVTASAELFDLVSGTFISTDDMVFAREFHTGDVAEQRQWYSIAGGQDTNGKRTYGGGYLYH